jgi:hypothetical protein
MSVEAEQHREVQRFVKPIQEDPCKTAIEEAAQHDDIEHQVSGT